MIYLDVLIRAHNKRGRCKIKTCSSFVLWMGRGDKEENNYFLTPFKPDNFTPQNEICFIFNIARYSGIPSIHPPTYSFECAVQCSATSICDGIFHFPGRSFLDFMSGWVWQKWTMNPFWHLPLIYISVATAMFRFDEVGAAAGIFRAGYPTAIDLKLWRQSKDTGAV